jgi:quercetin dioxygenase-like cupin family protein
MQIGHADTAMDYRETGGGGVRNRPATGYGGGVLLTGEEDSPNEYKFHIVLGGDVGEPTHSPRHHHTFDQVRYLLKGEYSVGTDQVMPEGHVGYFPESVYYGPQDAAPGNDRLTLQCGGASGLGYPSLAQRRKGYEALMASDGKIEGGMWVTVDENGKRHNQDGFEALAEQILGHKLAYAPARYNSIVLMDPDNFDWAKDREHQGVARKTIGVFTERDLRVGFVQLDAGASIPFGTEPAPEILFVKEGSISHNGEAHGRYSAFGTTTEEAPETLTAVEDSELFYIKLHTF